MADDKNDDTLERDSESKLDPAEERSRYFKKLEKWLQEAYAWQSVAAMFPYYVMSGHIANPTPGMNKARVVLINYMSKIKNESEEYLYFKGIKKKLYQILFYFI